MSTDAKQPTARFHLPQKPFTSVDAFNRVAAGQGSIGYAMAAEWADYNGHHLTLSWNEYRGYYVCEHFWGGRVVHVRSADPRTALRAAVDEYSQQGRGATLGVYLKAEHAHVAAEFNLLPGEEDHAGKQWWTWKHDTAAEAWRWEQQFPGCPAGKFMLECGTREEYDAAVKGHLERQRAGRKGVAS